MRRIVFAALLLISSWLPSFAASEGFTVQNCGTLAQPYTSGGFNAFAVDVNGNTCIFGTVSGTTTANQGTPNTAANSWPVAPQPYPIGATPVTASSAGASTTGTTISLPGVAGKTTYVCGVYIAANATAATSGFAFISGIVGGSINLFESVAALPAVGQVTMPFSPCIQASASNTAIQLTTPNPGAGGSQVLSAWGYQQ